jgi:hypothetical protein
VLDTIDRLLTRQVPISVRGQVKRVPAAKVIVLQLTQMATSGNVRAMRILLKYEEFSESCSDRSTKLQFVESDYTRAVAKSSSSSDDG